MLYFYIVQKTMLSTFAINVKWGIIMDKDFEKEVADTMSFYSSGSYSDIPIVSDFYIKRSQQ